MKRFAGVAVVAVAVVWWLFGDTHTRHSATSDQDGDIRFAHFGNDKDYELWRGVIEDFERHNPGIHVRQEYVVGFGDHYHTKLRQQILTQSLPDVALIQLGPFRGTWREPWGQCRSKCPTCRASDRSSLAAGNSLPYMARMLAERDVPTKTGKSNRWMHQSVGRITSRMTRKETTALLPDDLSGLRDCLGQSAGSERY